VANDELAQLAEQLAVATECQVRVQALLDAGDLELLELRDRSLRKRLVSSIRERNTPPQPERLAQSLCSPARRDRRPARRARALAVPGSGQGRARRARRATHNRAPV
jgi:hypothetical protein